MKAQLEDYQVEGVVRALEYDGFAFYSVMGTGKTLMALGVVEARHEREEVHRVLVVGPLSALDVWKDDARHLSVPVTVDFFRTGTLPPSQSHLHILVTNYEKIRKYKHKLSSWKPDMIIADESHRIKSRTKKQSKGMKWLGDRAKYKLALTGTPIDYSPLDIWSQYRFACPEVLGKTWTKFAEVYARRTGYGYTKWVVRKRKLSRLLKLIQSRMYRVEKSVLNLPPRKHRVVRFLMKPDGYRIYRALEQDAVAKIDENRTIFSPHILARMTRLQQLAGGFAPVSMTRFEQVDTGKLECLERQLNRIPSHEKIVIFARYLNEIEVIRKLCKQRGMHPLVLTGETKPEDRRSLRQKFVSSSRVKAFVSQIRTGGIGVNELVVARYLIVYSTTFSWIDFSQALDRIHRRGQTRPVICIYLLAKGTIDEDVFSTVREKGSRADIMLSLKARSEP